MKLMLAALLAATIIGSDTLRPRRVAGSPGAAVAVPWEGYSNPPYGGAVWAHPPSPPRENDHLTEPRPTQPLVGIATWYRADGMIGAAGPGLRNGSWRGSNVLVCRDERCIVVTLTDWCACGDRQGLRTLIDLSDDAFQELARLSRGILLVTVEEAQG